MGESIRGLTIREGTMIAAHPTVTKDVPANIVVGGNPAYILKQELVSC